MYLLSMIDSCQLSTLAVQYTTARVHLNCQLTVLTVYLQCTYSVLTVYLQCTYSVLINSLEQHAPCGEKSTEEVNCKAQLVPPKLIVVKT